MGNYVADGDKVLFNLRIVDAESGKVLHGLSKSVARDHLLDALPEFATALAGSLITSASGPPAAIKYASDWTGTPSGIAVHALAGHGERVLGTFGHKGLNLDAVGLVLSPSDDPQPTRPAK